MLVLLVVRLHARVALLQMNALWVPCCMHAAQYELTRIGMALQQLWYYVCLALLSGM